MDNVNWCPSGQGYPAYCPLSGYGKEYKYCCTTFYLGSLKPTCCHLPISAWNIFSIIFACIIVIALLTFFTCWFLPNCPLNQRMIANRLQREREAGIIQYDREPFRH
uniref:Uncharacterized protein n=1 Tax=Panagrolaimus sp. PS1159 TaxID=55785 RepID=A0AC35FV64_9BILA